MHPTVTAKRVARRRKKNAQIAIVGKSALSGGGGSAGSAAAEFTGISGVPVGGVGGKGRLRRRPAQSSLTAAAKEEDDDATAAAKCLSVVASNIERCRFDAKQRTSRVQAVPVTRRSLSMNETNFDLGRPSNIPLRDGFDNLILIRPAGGAVTRINSLAAVIQAN